jgi:cobalamin biosynthesis Co2+ chelatase CbiK
MGTKRIEFWPSPMWGKRYDNTEEVAAMFSDAFERVKAANPLVSLHVTIEVGDRYRKLRGRLAKRAALARKGKGVKCVCGHVTKSHTRGSGTTFAELACRHCSCREYSVGVTRKSAKLLKKKVSGTF